MQFQSENRRQFIDGLAKALVETLIYLNTNDGWDDEGHSDCLAPDVIASFLFLFP